MSPPAARRDDSAALWAGELADVRERLARLETRAEAHDKASAERQKAVLDAIREVEERLERAEGRAWRLALGLAGLGVGGGAGAVEILRGVLGG